MCLTQTRELIDLCRHSKDFSDDGLWDLVTPVRGKVLIKIKYTNALLRQFPGMVENS